MTIAGWILTVLLFIAGIVCIIEALTTTHSIWLSIPLLVLSGALIGPAFIMLAGLLGLYAFAIEVNGHRMEWRRRDEVL